MAETQEISPGQMKAVKFGAEEVLLANINGVYYAIGNVCPDCDKKFPVYLCLPVYLKT